MSRSCKTAFQARELCLGQGCVRYGAYAKREQLVGKVLTKSEPPLPFLYPLARLLEPRGFCAVALFKKESCFRFVVVVVVAVAVAV